MYRLWVWLDGRSDVRTTRIVLDRAVGLLGFALSALQAGLLEEDGVHGVRIRAGEKGTRSKIPPDLQLTQGMIEFAHECGIAPSQVPHEWDRFRNHHESKGNTFARWDLAWYTWCRNAMRWTRQRNTAPAERRTTTAEVVSLIERRLAR
jgi:hypothetical protein